MIAFSGVRSSCDMLARNSLLCWLRPRAGGPSAKALQRLLQLPRAFLDLLLQALNRCLQARGHPVQLVCEATQLVATAELDPLVVGARSDAGCCRPHLLHRANETAGEQHAQADPGGEERSEQQPVRQIFPRTGANAALSGCSTNTFQPAGPTVAQVLNTFSPRKLRPTVDPVCDEASALVT